MSSNAEARLVEAKDRAWLGEVAALEESLRHLRRRQAEAEQQLTAAGGDDLGELTPRGGGRDTTETGNQ
jgi:hypothetical protein